MENPSIAGIQEAYRLQADSVKKQKADQGDPPADGQQGQTPPQQAGADNFSDQALAAQLKSRYNLDLSDDEVLSRLKGVPGAATPPPPADTPPAPHSVKGATPQKPEDITDDQVSAFLKENERENVYQSYLSNKEKQDYDLVKEAQLEQIKREFSDVDEVEGTKLLHERFLIPVDEYDTSYSESEQKLGKYLLKQEADRIRGAVDYQVKGARQILYQQAKEQQDNTAFEQDVDAFVSKQPKNLTLALGKAGTIHLGEFESEIMPEVVENVRSILRSPKSFLEKFKDDKTGISIPKLYNWMMKAELFDQMIKSVAVDYYGRGLEAVGQTLGNYPDLSRRNGQVKNVTPAKQKAIDYNRKSIETHTGRNRQ